MQIRATNRYTGKEIIAKLREKPKATIKRKPTVPDNINPRKVA